MDNIHQSESDQELEYYDLPKVSKLLKRSQASIYRDAQAGVIPFELPPGKKIGMRFPREAIDVLAKRQRAALTAQQRLDLRFVPSTVADLWTAVKNAERIYGSEDVISFERALEWRDVNPDISMSVKQGKQLAGMVTFLPLEEEIIEMLLQDTLREKDIPDQAIRKWSETKISVYIAGIAVVPSENLQVDRQRGRFLLVHTMKWATLLSAQYDIKNWYAIGVTPDGQKLLEELGFRERSSLEDGKRKGYLLDDMITNPARFVQRFLQRIERS